MISVFAVNATVFKKNGDAILCPTEATVRMVAGGEYSMSMEHPIDPWGKWKYLVREAIIRMPVPAETIPAATVGYDTDVYMTTAAASLREGPSEPTTITYQTWSVEAEYAVGTKVTWQNKNYKCNYYDETSPYAHVAPPSCSWWKEIARKTAGSPEIATLKQGTELYLVEDYDTNWYVMQTTYGLQGYIKKNIVAYYRHITPSDLQPRQITEQLFRIKSVTVDRKSGSVSVEGVHVSNDLNGVLVENVKLVNVVPAMAITQIVESFMMDYKGEIATNITDSSAGLFTGEIRRKNGMFCLTDPDTGIVPTFNARFTRDNWDLFIIKRTSSTPVMAIRYAKNTNGIIWKVNTNSLITRVVPVAKGETGEDLYLPGKYVDSSYISNYPTIYMEALNVKGQVGKDDGTGTDTVWTEANLLTEMRTRAGERFSVDKADIPVTEVTVQLEQLWDTVEYSWLKGMQNLVLYDVVTVQDSEIGLDINLTVQEIEYDSVREKIKGIKLSNNIYKNSETVAGYNIVNGALTENKLAGGVKDDIISDAADYVMSIIR